MKTTKKNAISFFSFCLYGIFFLFSFTGIHYASVPGVVLESITFNYDAEHSTSDAITIRKNWQEDIHIPEWQAGQTASPAAYIQGTPIRIKVEFSAALDLTSAVIGADTIIGRLASIKPQLISFTNGKAQVYFELTTNAPADVCAFDQSWQWYYQTGSPAQKEKITISTSQHRIYIVLANAQSPWLDENNAINTEPWSDVLAYSCTWAAGETTPAGATTKILRYMYQNLGGKYNNSCHYTTGTTDDSFNLSLFLTNINKIGRVNCVDMAKALTTFANVLGCNTQYAISQEFGDTRCVLLIGQSNWSCSENFSVHAFVLLAGNVFDASLKADALKNPEGSPHEPKWMVNMSWSDYIAYVAAGQPFTPDVYAFGIAEP